MLLVMGIIVPIASCARDWSTREVAAATSPAGWCVARVVESRYGSSGSNTQVVLDFDGGCGSGAVAADGVNHALKLRWIDDSTLQIEHPKALVLTRNASGEILQCYDRKVRVVLRPA